MPARSTRSRSLDWPLSRAEKTGRVLKLFEADVRTANEMLEHKDKALRDKDKEIRRLSLGGRSTSCSSCCDPADESGANETEVTEHLDEPDTVEIADIEQVRPLPLGSTSLSREEGGARMEAVDVAADVLTSCDEQPLLTKSRSPRVKVARAASPDRDIPVKCSKREARKDLMRARSLPAKRFQNSSSTCDEQPRPWWAPALKAVQRGVQRAATEIKEFSKALIDELEASGEIASSSGSSRQVEIIEWTVEMNRFDGQDRKRLGLTLCETPPDQPLQVAEVVKGCALDNWNSGGLPVTVRIQPGGREKVIRRIAVQPGDEIAKIDGVEINVKPEDDFRKVLAKRLQRCNQLTVRRKIKPRIESVTSGVSEELAARVAAQAGA